MNPDDGEGSRIPRGPGPHTGDSVVMLNRDRETGCALQRRFESYIPRKPNCAALLPISYFYTSVSDLCIPRIGPPILLPTDHGNLYNRSLTAI
jgi:hypothetical protein